MKEIWKDIPGYEKYQASNFGRVKNKKTKLVLKYENKINGAGYYSLNLSGKDVMVHRAVASAFLGFIPSGKTVNHKNCNKLDNRIENLELLTPKQQIAHAKKSGRFNAWAKEMSKRSSGINNPKNKLSVKQAEEIIELLSSGKNTKNEITKIYKISRGAIYHLQKTMWHVKYL